MKIGTETMQMSSCDLVRKLDSEFQNVDLHFARSYAGMLKDWRYYWANDAESGFGQWPAEIVAEMQRQQRHIVTYNFIRPTVNNGVGAIMKSPFNIDYAPVDGEMSSLGYAAKDMFYIDWELFDCQTAYFNMVTAGMVNRGDIEMYIDRSFGEPRIGFRYRIPGTIMYDPYWKTGRHRDCKKAWVSSWMTPIEMLRIFPDAGCDIEYAIESNGRKKKGQDPIPQMLWQSERQARFGDEYGPNNGIIPYGRYDNDWGSQYRVISNYHMETVRRDFDCLWTGDELIKIPSEIEQLDDKVAWLNSNATSWTPEQVYTDYELIDIQYLTSYCPSLSQNILLQNAPTEIQCGCLQFFPWSAYRINGEFCGVVSGLRDMQEDINYLNAMKIHRIKTEGGGGANWYDRQGFKNEQEIQKWKKRRNDPTANFEVASGYLAQHGHGPTTPVQQSQPNAEIDNQLNSIYGTLWPRVSSVSPAARGQQESSGESGYLYRLKKMQSDVEIYPILEGLKIWWNEIGEAYLFQSQQTYGDGKQRSYYSQKTRMPVVINEYRELPDGTKAIFNDFSKLNEIRHQVVVTESEDAPTRQIEVMTTASEVIKSLGPEQALTRLKIGALVVKNIGSFSPEDKSELEELEGIELESAKVMMELNIAKAKAEIKKIEAEAQAAANPQPPQGGPPAPGGPPPGPGGKKMAEPPPPKTMASAKPGPIGPHAAPSGPPQQGAPQMTIHPPIGAQPGNAAASAHPAMAVA